MVSEDHYSHVGSFCSMCAFFWLKLSTLQMCDLTCKQFWTSSAIALGSNFRFALSISLTAFRSSSDFCWNIQRSEEYNTNTPPTLERFNNWKSKRKVDLASFASETCHMSFGCFPSAMVWGARTKTAQTFMLRWCWCQFLVNTLILVGIAPVCFIVHVLFFSQFHLHLVSCLFDPQSFTLVIAQYASQIIFTADDFLTWQCTASGKRSESQNQFVILGLLCPFSTDSVQS